MTVPETDANGSTEATGTIGDLSDTTLPLKASVTISIHEPGGRTTDKNVEIPVRTHDAMIGIRPDFDDGSVAENARAGFEVVAVDANSKRTALDGVTYSWVREDTTYQWYQKDGAWKYEAITRDRLMTSGKVDIGTGAPLKLAQNFPYGSYRLTLTDPKSGTASSYASIPAGRRAPPATVRTASRSRPTSRPTMWATSRMCRSSRRRTARRWSWWRATRCSPPR